MFDRVFESALTADIYITESLIVEKQQHRCTKVTGQMSSTRKDKKYMRCTRVGGKLKRVHYGDPHLRIKKSNPKKRKSFRARHKCSSAKPGTAKYFSCKNW
jgi:transcription termination factor Rho